MSQLIELLKNLPLVFNLVKESGAAATLTVAGLLLALVAILLVIRATSSTSALLKGALFASILGSILLPLAGQGITIIDLWNRAPNKASDDVVTTEQAIKSLYQNSKVNWAVRLIPYDPETSPELSISRLTRLGKPDQLYTFVGDYNELRGNTAERALEKLGGAMGKNICISAIIFPLSGSIYPANARGLLQVINEIDSKHIGDVRFHAFTLDRRCPDSC
jgi:hypothetical protein